MSYCAIKDETIKPETPQKYTFQKKTVIPDIDEVQ